jgi:Protein of unknown function (Porph_ging).
MKKAALFFVSLVLLPPAIAQKQKAIEPAVLECQYKLLVQRDTTTGTLLPEDLMILRIGKNMSQFFSRYTFFGDSLRTDPVGSKIAGRLTVEAIRRRDFNSIPGAKTTSDYLYKNYPTGKMTTQTSMLISGYTYEEPFEAQKWIMIDSSKQVLDYPCNLASCNFRGHTFLVWYTPDIAISDGPWKLSGLPGLIMEAYDKNFHYHYTMVGIKSTNLQPVSVYNFWDRKYEQTTRIKFLKAKKELEKKDQNQVIKTATDIDLGSSTDASTRKHNAYDFIERDYH